MDGNRRFGIQKYQRAYQGHVDGAKKLTEFITWCIEHEISILTVYAFSTENWDRDPEEIQALFSIVHSYCEDIQSQALKHGIRVQRVSTQEDKIPPVALQRLDQLVHATSSLSNPALILNICFSYGSRGEIVHACRNIVQEVLSGNLTLQDLTEARFHQELLTASCPDPDVIVRTSGEMRLSNFLLWQSAYSELFFIEKTWPEVEKQDFVQVLDHYAQGRHRRFGK
jgi:undecaprenyl diphosphate synthase